MEDNLAQLTLLLTPTDTVLRQEIMIIVTGLLLLPVRRGLTNIKTLYGPSIRTPGKQLLEYRLTMDLLSGRMMYDIVIYQLIRLSRMVLRHMVLSLLYRAQTISRPEVYTWDPLRSLTHRILGPSQAIFTKIRLLHSSWERMVVRRMKNTFPLLRFCIGRQ